MLFGMSKGRSFVPGVLLLAAVLMAAQPLTIALGLTFRSAGSTLDGQSIVICSAHGAVTVPGEDGAKGQAPAPAHNNPDCLYCALGCGSSKVSLVGSPPAARLSVGLVILLNQPIAAEDVPRSILRLLTSPSRGPPLSA